MNTVNDATVPLADESMTTVLSVHQLQMRFGGLLAVDGVNFQVKDKEVFAIIGPNGAGKTTVFNCISGFYKPTKGRIMYEGADIAGQTSHKLARKGIVRTFQNVRLFRNMTVVENLLVAQHAQLNTNLLSGLINTKKYRASEQAALSRAAFWLNKVRLRDVANREAGNLSYGQQRRLEIARCMITHPKLLLLDEPAAGLNPQETVALDALIRDLRETCGVTVLLIEHDMRLVMDVSDRILVMEYGQPIAEGTPEEIKNNPRVIQAYLGVEDE
jgi:ABC-type branched-chain amino acid transport systems, ATPase component